eukprot:366025-Chlamydomonas_euryale.AAC.4
MPHRSSVRKLDPQHPTMERGRSAPPDTQSSDSETVEEQSERCWPQFRTHLRSVEKVMRRGVRAGQTKWDMYNNRQPLFPRRLG